MKAIDTHAHLNFNAFGDDWRSVADAAVAGGVSAIVVPSTLIGNSQKAITMATQHPALWAAVGLHPTHVGDEVLDIASYRGLAAQPRVVAIGEVGLDRFRPEERASYNEQKAILKQFLGLSVEVGKPAIIHSRPSGSSMDTYEDLVKLLGDLPQRPRFVLHCYIGNVALMQEFLRLGGMISLTGIVTLANAPTGLAQVIQEIPLERLMVETDSPYLKPKGWQEPRNTPLGVLEVISHIAKVRGMPIKEIARVTTDNAINFFNLTPEAR